MNWHPLIVPIGGAVMTPEGFIVRDCSNEEGDVWNWNN
jgi:hypothetical protein